MNPKLIVIDSEDGLWDLYIKVAAAEYVTYDTETTGLSSSDRVIGFSICFDEDSAYYVILEEWKDGQLIPKPYVNQAKDIVDLLLDKKLIMHNGLFDCRITESFFKISLIDALHTDTMIMAHVLDENRSVALKELGRTMFGEDATLEAQAVRDSIQKNGGSLTKANYEMYKADSYILAKYGAKDALLTMKLFMTMLPQLIDKGLFEFFYEDESMPLLKGPTYELNTTGMLVDVHKLIEFEKSLEAESAELYTYIHSEIREKVKDKYPGTNKKNTFNIGSNQQLSWLLYGQYGLECATLTDSGKDLCKALGLRIPYTRTAKKDFIAFVAFRKGKFGLITVRDPWAYLACDKQALEKHAKRYKWIRALLDYNKKQKLLNTYVKGTLERLQYSIIRPQYLQHGTMTGRYSSTNPNFQNLPRGDQRIKDCIIARKGKVFVSADFSQLEPRIFSYYSQDPNLMQAFDGTSDFYSVVGMAVYDKCDCTPQKDGPNSFGVKYKKLRDLAKTIALASAYGATPYRLSHTTGKNTEETKEDMLAYFEKFPGVRQMMVEAHDQAKTNGYVTNLFGRVRHLPDAVHIPKGVDHWDLDTASRNVLNMACNFRIQSTGASIVNRAAIRFHSQCKKFNLSAKLVSQIHDELVVECPEEQAEAVSALLRDAMENTVTLVGVPLEAIPRITKSLKKP